MLTSFMSFYRGYTRTMSAVSTLGGVVTFVVMWLIDANVVGRKFFNAPVPGAVEITAALLAVLIMLPMAHTQATGDHLRVTLVTRHLPFPVRRFLLALAMLSGAALMACLTYALYEFALRSWRVGEYAWGSNIRIPLYPIKGLICLGAGMLTVQFLLDAVRIGVIGVTMPHDDIASEDGTPDLERA